MQIISPPKTCKASILIKIITVITTLVWPNMQVRESNSMGTMTTREKCCWAPALLPPRRAGPRGWPLIHRVTTSSPLWCSSVGAYGSVCSCSCGYPSPCLDIPPCCSFCLFVSLLQHRVDIDIQICYLYGCNLCICPNYTTTDGVWPHFMHLILYAL